jgi:hypothetical protein
MDIFIIIKNYKTYLEIPIMEHAIRCPALPVNLLSLFNLRII